MAFEIAVTAVRLFQAAFLLAVQTISREAFIRAHLTVLTALLIFGVTVIYYGTRLQTDEQRRRMRLFFVILMISLRTIRYPIDAVADVFTWDGIFSLHVCHINLILLAICLIKPNDFLFNYTFLIGIPMGLVSGLIPGDITLEAPLLILRGGLFITTHLLMVIGAIYLAVVEKMKPSWRHLKQLYLLASVQFVVTYVANRLFGTNFLYIMTPVEGTPMITLSDHLGWPGYALAMVAITYFLMLVSLLSYKVIAAFFERHSHKGRHLTD